MQGFAMLFPGQGSQSIGMLSELSEASPVVRQTFEEAGEVLDQDLWKLVGEGPAELLNRTEWTQPALLAAGIAVWRTWNEAEGPAPRLLAGHSLGEYTALVAAGALEFRDAIGLVHRRGRYMQEAVPAGEGAMAAILGLDDDAVEEACRKASEGRVVVPANYNSPGQLVIAGHADAVERAVHRCREAGAKRAMTLPVSVPSHCPLMEPAARRLAGAMEEIEFRSPALEVLHNVDVTARSEPDAVRQALLDQLSRPVRWTDTIRTICDRGILHLGECGPGKVLAGLGRRIRREAEWLTLEQPATLREAVAEWKLMR